MSGIDNLFDPQELLAEFQELSPNNDPVEGMRIAAEARLIGGAAEIEDRIETMRETPYEEGGWRDPEWCRDTFAGYDSETQREQFLQIQNDLVRELSRVPTTVHSIRAGLSPPTELVGVLKDIVVWLHNPVVRESLLLAVDDDFEPQAREALAEVAAVAWGYIEAITWDGEGDHIDVYFEYLAEAWDMEVEDLRQVAAELDERRRQGGG